MGRLKDFIACPDILIKKHGLYCAAVWGRIYRYSQGQAGKCTASQQTIADELGIARSTVYRYMQILIDEKYIEDLTPTRKHITHEYRPTDKLSFEITVGVAEKDTSVAQKDTSVAEKDTSKEVVKNKDSKRGKPRDPRLDHPAIQTYHGTARLWPPIAIRDRIISVVGENTDEWKEAIVFWIGRGWKPTNVGGMLDVYQKGEYKQKEKPEMDYA